MKFWQYLTGVVLIACVIFLVFTAYRGIFFPDEGYILQAAQRMLSGQILYRDFDFVYTPLTAGALYVTFLLTGSSLFYERLVSLILSLITGYFLYRTGRLLTPHPLLGLTPLLVYITWGPSHINFIWPGMWASNFAIIACCSLYEGVLKKHTALLLTAGISSAAVILTKQNFAAAVVINLSLLFFLLPALRNKMALKPFFLGLILPLLLTTVYFLLTNSLQDFVKNSSFYLVNQVLIEKTLDTPLFVPGNPVTSVIKYSFYFSPLILALVSGVVIRKKQPENLILVTFVTIFFLFGFRPVTDYVHLVPLLALTGLPLLVLLSSVKEKIYHLLLTTFSLLLIVVGIWSALFFGYYRWNPPLSTPHLLLNTARGGVWVDPGNLQRIQDLNNALLRYSGTENGIYLNYYAPMVYFLTAKENPTRYDYPDLPESFQRIIVKDLESKNVQIILTYPLQKQNTGAVAEFMRTHFTIRETVNDYELWIRN